MSKVKKVFAIILSMAMILGMSLTTFAVPQDVSGEDINKSNITVHGLSEGVDTTIKVYQFATLQYDSEHNEYSWRIEDWADDYVKLSADGKEYTIAKEDEQKLKSAVTNSEPAIEPDDTATESGTSHKFENMPVGGYLIIPSDNRADYAPLFVTNNYDRLLTPDASGKPAAKNVDAYAKSNTHTITKEQSDSFAQIGDIVSYTINATFPMSENEKGEKLNQFVITDTPSGLLIDKNTVKVTLGTAENDITDQVTISVDPSSSVLTVKFDQLLNGGHDGKDVVITYNATVIDTDYNNSASATSNTVDYTTGTTTGDTGSIQITKVDVETQEELTGAEFQVYDLGEDRWDASNPGTPMTFTKDSEGNYRPALSTDTVKTNTITVDNNGVLKIVGLDEGNYHFVETKAPNGYSINDLGLTVAVNDTDKTDVIAKFEDTKLASLPSTGGIGTTIFTIGGCAIMIAAAGLYFASRRKENK